MGIGRRLIDALTHAPGQTLPREIETESGGLVARARMRGTDRYACEIDRLTVRSPDRPIEDPGAEVQRQAQEIERRVTYLPERLRALEIDRSRGEAILRTPAEDVRERRFFEARLRGGTEVELERLRYQPESSERETCPTTLTHDSLERLVDDLADVLSGEQEP